MKDTIILPGLNDSRVGGFTITGIVGQVDIDESECGQMQYESKDYNSTSAKLKLGKCFI